MNTVTKVYFSPHASFIFLKVARILPTEILPTEISTIYELLLRVDQPKEKRFGCTVYVISRFALSCSKVLERHYNGEFDISTDTQSS